MAQIPVYVVFDLVTRETYIFPVTATTPLDPNEPPSPDHPYEAPLEHIDVIITASQRARTDIASGGLPPRQQSEFVIISTNIES